MSKQIFVLLAGTAITMLAVMPVLAHDPKEHEADATPPDCAAMKDMDTSKTAKDDPVLMAMLQKCADAMQDDTAHDHGEAHGANDVHHPEEAHSDAHESH